MGRYYGPTDTLLARVLALLGDPETGDKVGPQLYRDILGTLTEVVKRQQEEITSLKAAREESEVR